MSDTDNISVREARGLRGRYGCDFWEKFVNQSRDIKRDFLAKVGVPESRMTATLAELMSLLYDEDIRQTNVRKPKS